MLSYHGEGRAQAKPHVMIPHGSVVRLEDGSLAVQSHAQILPLAPTGEVAAKGAVLASELRKPLQGGGADSFDLVLGPQTSDAILGQEISHCLFEKGFCVLRCLTSLHGLLETMRDLAEDGQLGRLPEEVEEGYLGLGGKGRILWLDPEKNLDPVLVAADQMLGQHGAL